MKIRSRFLAVLVVAVLVASGAQSALAQVLFTTQEDFVGWSDNSAGNLFQTSITGLSTDSSTTNGLGNNSNAGGAGTSGSITVTRQPAEGNYGFFYSPGEQSNAAF